MKTVVIHDHTDQLLCSRTFIYLHTVEIVGQGLKIFDGIGALFTKCFQGQVKGYGSSAGQDCLELINQILRIHKGKSAHKHVNAAAAAFDARHLNCYRVILFMRPPGAERTT